MLSKDDEAKLVTVIFARLKYTSRVLCLLALNLVPVRLHTGMSTSTGALQTTYSGQKRVDQRTFNRRILLIIERSKPTNEDDRLRTGIPANSTIRYLQRLFIHKKITPARFACLCFKLGYKNCRIGLVLLF